MRALILFLLFAPMASAQIMQEDKVKHFAAGGLVGSASYAIVYNKTKSENKALIASVLSSLLIGAAKEVFDSRKGGTGFNSADLGATAAGGLTIGLTINIFNK